MVSRVHDNPSVCSFQSPATVSAAQGTTPPAHPRGGRLSFTPAPRVIPWENPAPTSSRTNVRDPLAFCHFPGDSSLRFGMTEEQGRAPRYFAPMGPVRRFVGMLLQAGIPPRVGRNDIKKELTAPLGGKKVRLQMQPHLFASPSLQVIRRGRCRTPCPSPRSRGGRVRRQAPRRPFRRTGGAASSRARRTRTSFRAKGTCAPR